jgi:hypothetical protein
MASARVSPPASAKSQFLRPIAISGHSAHVGQEVVVHYRWHPLFGRRVRRHYGEQRASGEVVHVEAAPGVVTVVAAWMLDPVACAEMEIGAPRVALAALAELHHLLIAQRGAGTGSAPAEHGARFREAPRHEPARTQRGSRAAGPAVDGGGGRRGGDR